MTSLPTRAYVGKALSALRHVHLVYYALAAMLVFLLLSHGGEALAAWPKQQQAWLNPLVVLSVGALLFVVLGIALSPAGRWRLGHAEEKPYYSTLSWLAMLFAAGMGSGLVFSGAAEPLIHQLNPPLTAQGLGDATTRSMILTFYSWGVHAWVVYALAALAVAYGAYNHNRPMVPSATLMPLNAGHALPRYLREIIDAFAIIATLFGVVVSLAHGSVHVAHGLGLEQSYGGALGVLAAISACFIVSSLSGIGRGIKWLSILNIMLALVLLLYVAVVTHMPPVMPFFHWVGGYLAALPALSLMPQYVIADENWLYSWATTYFLWWVAWAPFVGVFIARISRGRSLRSFILGMMLAPVGFSLMWFAVFGRAAQTRLGMSAANLDSMPAIAYGLLESLPMPELAVGGMALLMFVFLITSADSGAYVLAMLSNDGTHRPARRNRLLWGAVLAGLTGWMLISASGLGFMRAVMVLFAIPYLVILLAQVGALILQLWRDRHVL